MGSNGFSSDKKQNRVNLLKLLLDINLPTQRSSNPLETLLSGLDSGSLEDLLQKNKKSHHDDWDSKKKRHHDDDWDSKKKCHHDDCNDNDWDHKKKHNHDDCGCKKKKHDHDDCGCKKKKHDHDDCGCKKKKHDHDDCGCKKKKKKRCKCEPGVKSAICELIEDIFAALNATPSPTPGALEDLLEDLQDLLEDCFIPEKLLERLEDLIEDLGGAPVVSPTLIATIIDFLEDLLKCLGFRRGDCGSDGNGGITCGCGSETVGFLCTRIAAVLNNIGDTTLPTPLIAALEALRAALGDVDCIVGNVTPIRAHLRNLVNAINQGNPGAIAAQVAIVLRDLEDLAECLDCPPAGGGGTAVPTLREQLLALVGETVRIDLPTGPQIGVLVTVQIDYLVLTTAEGTVLIPLDEIEQFDRE